VGGAWVVGVDRVGFGFGFGVAFAVAFGVGGGGVYGVWPWSGAFPSTLAGGGKVSTSVPSRIACMMARQV
jgi:hypothetical protein